MTEALSLGTVWQSDDEGLPNLDPGCVFLRDLRYGPTTSIWPYVI